MRNFFLGAAVVVAVVLLVAAGQTEQAASLPTLNDLPLAHAFSARFLVRVSKPLKFTLPSETGFVITYLRTEPYSFKVFTNGILSRSGKWHELGISGNETSPGNNPSHPGNIAAVGSNPPVIVPPGGTLEISTDYQYDTPLTLGGYFISKADLGL